MYGGYPTFLLSIGMIGFVTALIRDAASHLGCFIFLLDKVNAIAFVALGTSVPGTETALDVALNVKPLYGDGNSTF